MENRGSIREINKWLVFHKPLVKGTGVCGLAGDYHDPRKGTTLLLSKDRSFTVEWHEGAHSFLSQTSPLGFIINTFNESIYMIMQEIFFYNVQDDRKTKCNVVARLLDLREMLLNSFLVPHEMFALCTERVGILGDRFFESMYHFDETYRQESEYLASIDAERVKFGLEQHKLAYEYMQKFEKTYGHLMFAEDVVKLLIPLLPTVITNISPREMLYESIENCGRGMSVPCFILEKILENKPKWAPDPSINRKPDFWELVFKYLNIGSEYGDIMKNVNLLAEWVIEFVELLPLSEEFKRQLNIGQALNMKFLYFQRAVRGGKLKENVKFTGLDEDTTDFIRQFKTRLSKGAMGGIFLEDVIKEKENIVYDPLSIPPPITLKWENDVLVLVIRSDIFQPNGLNHLLHHCTEYALTDMLADSRIASENQAFSYPILCFSDYCELKVYECENGFGKCLLARKIENVALRIKEGGGVEVNPLLICCKEDIARVIPLSKLRNGPKNPDIYPFRIEKIEPELYGFREKD